MPASRRTIRTLPCNLQHAALKKAGCQTVFKDEGLSGATTKRPALLCCLKKLEHGDTLIVWKLDRLGRSLLDLITMLDDLRARGVKFHSLAEAIDTATPTGRAMWQMIGVLAELGWYASRSAARRVVEQHGVRVNGERAGLDRVLRDGDVLQAGKRNVVRVRIG